MRIVFLLIVVFGVYYYLSRQAPVGKVVEEATASEVAPLVTGPKATAETVKKSGYGRQVQRARNTLEAVKTRNGDGEF
ncbi:MAG: hypothetical protein ABI680_15050 [Chthoniobacteraceae bacterium]